MKKTKKIIIKKILHNDFAVFTDIVASAYPGMNINTPEEKKKTLQRLKKASKDPHIHYYGLYSSQKLIGGMALYDFALNFHSIMLPVGGVGLVAVDLLHKKEHICKELLQFFHRKYYKQNVPMTALYPFRPDFYKKMGYGLGTKMNQYYFRPIDLPRLGGKEKVQYMTVRDHTRIKACYARFHAQHHGMLTERATKWSYLFAAPKERVIVYRNKNKVQGYIVYSFKKVQDTNWIKNDLMIREFIYETPEALHGLLEFLSTQSDQIHRIIYATQDDAFHHILFDPRNGTDRMFVLLAHEVNIEGVGIMYRVINTKRLVQMLKTHDFNEQTCTITLHIKDDFLKENNGSITVQFRKGKPRILSSSKSEVEVNIHISDFSSLIMGVIDIKSLYMYGLIDISKPRYVDVLDRLFFSRVKPITTTQF